MNLNISPANITDIPMKDSIERRKVVWQYTKELWEVLCAEGAEGFWQQWMHPGSGTEYPAGDLDEITKGHDDIQHHKSRDFWFTVLIMPVAKAEYGIDIYSRLEHAYNYIRSGYHFNKSETCRIWNDSTEICNIQDELASILREMSARMYAPRIICTNIRPSLMTYEHKMRLLFTIAYIWLLVKLLVF